MTGMTVTIDHRMLQVSTILGLMLGVLGSLYLTYDLLGRTQNLLRWFIRVSTPALIGLAVLGAAGTIVYLRVYPDIDAIFGGALFGSVGCLVGIFNGLFFDPSSQPSFPFSLRHAIVGMVVTFFLILGGDLPLVLMLGRPAVFALEAAAATSIAGSIASGIWRFINRLSLSSGKKIPLFSWQGSLIGLIAASAFGFVAAFAIDTTFGVPITQSAAGALFLLLYIAPAGAITGGVSRFVFWWANNLPGYQLGAIGVLLTLIGFLVQLIEPLVMLLGITVK